MDIRQQLGLIKQDLRQIEYTAEAPYWESARRWKIAENAKALSARIEAVDEETAVMLNQLENPVSLDGVKRALRAILKEEGFIDLSSDELPSPVAGCDFESVAKLLHKALNVDV